MLNFAVFIEISQNSLAYFKDILHYNLFYNSVFVNFDIYEYDGMSSHLVAETDRLSLHFLFRSRRLYSVEECCNSQFPFSAAYEGFNSLLNMKFIWTYDQSMRDENVSNQRFDVITLEIR